MRARNAMVASMFGVMAAVLLSAPPVSAGNTAPAVFHAKAKEGQVWVNVDLARQRTKDGYVPLLVAVRNDDKTPITLDRSSFALVAANGTTEHMPRVEALRVEYGKEAFDRSVVQTAGFPVGTLLDEDDAVRSNFFPPVSPEGGVVLDDISLPSHYWMSDIIYFRQLPSFAEGHAVTLEITAKGWEKPMKVRVHV